MASWPYKGFKEEPKVVDPNRICLKKNQFPRRNSGPVNKMFYHGHLCTMLPSMIYGIVITMCCTCSGHHVELKLYGVNHSAVSIPRFCNRLSFPALITQKKTAKHPFWSSKSFESFHWSNSWKRKLTSNMKCFKMVMQSIIHLTSTTNS